MQVQSSYAAKFSQDSMVRERKSNRERLPQFRQQDTTSSGEVQMQASMHTTNSFTEPTTQCNMNRPDIAMGSTPDLDMGSTPDLDMGTMDRPKKPDVRKLKTPRIPDAGLLPGQRATTDIEREQRKMERIVRNRLGAEKSRNKKKKDEMDMKRENEQMKRELEDARGEILALRAQLALGPPAQMTLSDSYANSGTPAFTFSQSFSYGNLPQPQIGSTCPLPGRTGSRLGRTPTVAPEQVPSGPANPGQPCLRCREERLDCSLRTDPPGFEAECQQCHDVSTPCVMEEGAEPRVSSFLRRAEARAASNDSNRLQGPRLSNGIRPQQVYGSGTSTSNLFGPQTIINGHFDGDYMTIHNHIATAEQAQAYAYSQNLPPTQIAHAQTQASVQGGVSSHGTEHVQAFQVGSHVPNPAPTQQPDLGELDELSRATEKDYSQEEVAAMFKDLY